MMPAAMMSPTARPAFSTESNAASSTLAVCGLGSSLTVTSVITPSRPSEPVNSASRSKPGASRALEPRLRCSPSTVRMSTLSTLCTVRPYFRQCTPPAFSATLPPMEQAICEEGSGA
ncbi:hypothetical protein D3C72_1930340 [compost metagenome]